VSRTLSTNTSEERSLKEGKGLGLGALGSLWKKSSEAEVSEY
jgi:hypothetical protein